ncbi:MULTISPECIES: hypothetical protein [Pedobacter]|uniref:Uncharacterized protein n=1 Tax=Pedobacter zeae TaxID=1737356 RepID=A0A7W6K7S8_9SPHI|nr:hypothetical protein [Pedobacter zeae]MBB4106783.1 hypothetical protein [Pedobacter zeae]GGH03715.1 hypothetical protein GCM10007422_18950 [Pedobacter zeae]
MKRLQFVWVFILSLTALNTYAQTTYTGCVIYQHNTGLPRTSDPIYTDVAGGSGSCNGYTVTFYSSTTNSKSLDSYCSITPPLANASSESAGNGDPNYRNCSVNGQCGIIRTVTVTECPIDDSAIMLFAACTVLALGFIKMPVKFGA